MLSGCTVLSASDILKFSGIANKPLSHHESALLYWYTRVICSYIFNNYWPTLNTIYDLQLLVLRYLCDTDKHTIGTISNSNMQNKYYILNDPS